MLNIQDLHLSFGQSAILKGVSFNVTSGETVGIIGPNGSGKTTLFNAISGFVMPASGSINFKQNEIAKSAPHLRAKLGIGRVFQNFGVFRDLTVLENIILAMESRRGYLKTFFPWSAALKAYKLEALKLLEQFGLALKAQDKAGSLSGGQMRLLEIIRTIAFLAELLLLDEPTAGVSPKMKDDVSRLITQLQQMKKTILIIEHDLNFIQKFCNRIIVLDQGKVVLDDTPERVRSSPLLQEIYFGASSLQL